MHQLNDGLGLEADRVVVTLFEVSEESRVLGVSSEQPLQIFFFVHLLFLEVVTSKVVQVSAKFIGVEP